MPRAERENDSMELAVLKELIIVVIAPRADERVVECIHPPRHRFERSPEGRSRGNALLADPGQLGAELGELRVAHGANERLELRLDLERAGTLHDRPDFDDLHLMPRH